MDLNKRKKEEVDRISNLPDSLVHHILSFLDIKHVAQASVLSKRWRYIWITVPILEFYDSGCPDPTDSETNRFMDFVDGTLHRRQADIQRFDICWRKHLNEYRVNSWISSAVRHNVQQFSLNLTQDEPLIITQSLFTCESLVSLQMVKISSTVRCPYHISLPKLRFLELEGVEFSNENWKGNLFSNCPALEILDLIFCIWLDMPYFCVSTPTLKRFNIKNWNVPFEEDDGLRNCTFKVDAPNLEYFGYGGSIAKEYVLTTFPLLVKADVEFHFKPDVTTREQWIGHGAAISQLLRALVNVKCLRVSDGTLQALCLADGLLEKLPTFHNAKKLTIMEEVTNEKALVAFLKATPNLESLVFDKAQPDDDEEDDVTSGDADEEEEDDVTGSDADDEEEDDVTSSDADDEEDDDVTGSDADAECLFLHLKSVKFREFVGCPIEMIWVKLILKNAKALQTMSISYCDRSCRLNIERKNERIMEITSLPRASPNCVFIFHSGQDTLVMNKWSRDEDRERKWKFEADMKNHKSCLCSLSTANIQR